MTPLEPERNSKAALNHGLLSPVRYLEVPKRAAEAGPELSAFPPRMSRRREVSFSPADAFSASHQQISQVSKS